MERLATGETLAEIYAERSRNVKETKTKLRLADYARRNMREEQKNHLKLIDELKAQGARNRGKRMA